MTSEQLAADVLAQAKSSGLTIVTAESCTAGQLALELSRAVGAAKFFHGGFVTYTKAMKNAVLGVPMPLLMQKSAVCAEVAIAMAEGALERSPADISVSITGVAGPEPDEDGNPVGLVYCATARRGRPTRHVRLECGSDEQEVILETSMCRALLLLKSTF